MKPDFCCRKSPGALRASYFVCICISFVFKWKSTQKNPRRASRAGSEMSRNTRFYKGFETNVRFFSRRASRAGSEMSINSRFYKGFETNWQYFHDFVWESQFSSKNLRPPAASKNFHILSKLLRNFCKKIRRNFSTSSSRHILLCFVCPDRKTLLATGQKKHYASGRFGGGSRKSSK